VKKILLTNNIELLDIDNTKYDNVYTDSPYVVEYFNDAIYLDTLLDKNFNKDINSVRKKGYEINSQIINNFFPNYRNRNIDIMNIKIDFTNLYINIVKLFKLIELYPNDEITIGITEEELYDYNSPEILQGLDNRFANIYYLIVELSKIKKVKLLNIKIKKKKSLLGHYTFNNWFLRLVNLDKKVLIFNFLKKMNLINKNKKKIYLYKKNVAIRETEPYLYDLGYWLIDMPKINFEYSSRDGEIEFKKIRKILDRFFEINSFNNIFKLILYEMYKRSIKYYAQKEIYAKKYLSKLNKSVSIILTNTINGFDSHIFAKQLQQNGYKIINFTHCFTANFHRKKDLDFYECQAPDMTLCTNSSESELYKQLVPYSSVYPISLPQEAKKKRFRFLRRFCVNKILKIDNSINIFYPSTAYPLNNVTTFGWRQSDKLIYEFEKSMINLLSNANKKAIYKNYPMRGFVNKNPLIKYAKSFTNIKVISENYDFRFVSSAGDIFILGNIGASSTLTWMLGEDKPIIFLYTNKHRFINQKGKKILEKGFIVVDIDNNNWTKYLSNILDKPYKELVKIWNDKKIYRDQCDEEWLMGTNLHAGKLASKYIEKFINEKT